MKVIFMSTLLLAFITTSYAQEFDFTTHKKADHPQSEILHPEIFLCVSDSSSKCASLAAGACDKDCYTIQNKYNYVFAKNCSFIDKKTGKAITPKYIIVFDRRDETVTYLKLKNGKGKEYLRIKKTLYPKADKEIYFITISNDTGYVARIEGNDEFMEYEAAFAKTIEDARAVTDTAGKSTPPAVQAPPSATDPSALTTDGKTKKEDLTKLNSLDAVLNILLNRYPERSVISENYFLDLNCLRIKIGANFNITYFIADTVRLDKLLKEAQAMIDTLKSIYPQTLQSNAQLFETIHSKYVVFISRQLTPYHLTATQLQVPDLDRFSLTIVQRSPAGQAEVFKREFKVSGGFKIDFSAGVFVTGLTFPEFTAEKHTFQYKNARYDVSSGGVIDTVYLGDIRDTTGKLIHAKDPRMNYAAGFLCHGYWRTGTFANAGVATGILVNSTGFQILVGGSLLLSAKKSRIAFSYGIAIGNQRTISPTIKQSMWNDNYRDGTLYQTPNEVPRFTEINDIPTIMRWNTSWYFGLTYNFKSVIVHW
jgi:hypothetical protein